MAVPTIAPANNQATFDPLMKKPAGRLRWLIVGMLFLATVLNYLDRYSLGFLAPTLKSQFHWSPEQFGWVLFSFQATYALMNLPSGALMDRIGLRKGYALAVVWWSFASMGHALARSVVGFGVWRALLGIGEAANFPAAVKSISEWFPQRERATATGILNAGANVGAMVAPLILFFLVSRFGWKAAFVATGALGFFWTVAWWVLYREPASHPNLSSEERTWILQDGPTREPQPSIPWTRLVGERRAWAFILGKMFSDPVWAFFLFWLPTFLSDVHHLPTGTQAMVITGIYLAADVGSLGGGWMSSRLIQLGWPVNRARKTTMAIAAALVPTIAIVGFNNNLYLAVGLCGLAVAMHQWWSSNLFTTGSDMFPSEAMGTLVGMGQLFGSGLAMFVQPMVGYCIQHFHSYTPIFVVAAFAYPLALLCLHTLAPKLDKADLGLA
jgi:ACS family hexuronate transporter-like MFS transporter